ncbi:MiaB/RimO family radical SAM methylthiotransferase [bacterium]|nr:MAG: MiaB/RimO family radical SAM methylthiotransferase [bacterium]
MIPKVKLALSSQRLDASPDYSYLRKKDKIGILSLGCPRNLVDSESILGRLKAKGYPLVDLDKADIGIVNTCAFIEDAKRESIDAILDLIQLKKEGKLKKVIVYGCLPQRYQDYLIKELPEIDAFCGRISLNHDFPLVSLTPKHYRYLKICEGCINACSFCVIHRIKGRFASLDRGSLLKKVEEFDRQKIAELNIIGQDITGYGLDLYGAAGLPQLLRRLIARSKNIGWIRLLYTYPNRVSDDLLSLIKDQPRICKYIDLPIQHINDRILKLMNRRTTSREILRLIDKIRKNIPGAAIRTSLIVGFPSETDAQFRDLLKFIRQVRFERLGAFIYSPEEGTPAANFKKQIPRKIKLERLDMIMAEQQKISRQVNRGFLGKTIEVLIDEKEKDGYLGRSQYDAPEVDGLVYVKSKSALKPGEFVKVRIEDTLEYDLVGSVLG